MSSPTSSNQTLTSASTTKSSRMLNALVVDDTNLFRTIMAEALNSLAQVTVIGKATNGTECLELLAALPEVDVVFLDVEMPVMNGLETLRVIRQRHPKMLVVMVSGHNKTNMDITIEALSLGAYDFIGKPEGASGGDSQEQLRKQLFVLTRSIIWQRSQDKMRARHQALGKTKTSRVSNVSADFPTATTLDEALPLKNEHSSSSTFEIKGIIPAKATPQSNSASIAKPIPQQAPSRTGQPTAGQATTANHQNNRSTIQANQPNASVTNQEKKQKPISTAKIKRLSITPKVLLIGISTGGPVALMELIPKLPSNLGLPVLVVQHMPPKFTQSLADSLNTKTGLTIKEAVHGETLKPNVVYIAPGGFHMEIEAGAKGEAIVNINQKPPVNSCRPSVDVLFKSAPAVFKNNTLSVVMTGMGKDGCEGVRYLKQTVGTYCVTQSEESCVIYGMPKAVDDEQLNDESVPLNNLANRICELLGKQAP
ncbi:MAG: chemotaxis-specific protein-glutamate methyltransferase CheB [Vampirovibrio sp.]|nr:chemotaxis-specific protein-glutamate methyltransferase CheB [Vampirovibrio sp.]